MLFIDYQMLSASVNTSVPAPCIEYVLSKNASCTEFPQQLVALRKPHSLTQQQLAERIGIHVVQLRRCEAGSSQPALEVIRKIATALQVSADMLLFGKDERCPDDDLRVQFEAISRFDPDERHVVRSLLEVGY